MVALREAVASNDTIVAQKYEQRGLDSPTRRASVRSNILLPLRVGASIAFIAASTFVLFRLIPVNPTTAGFLYLVAILLIATKGGLVESTVASVAAMLCFNFFFLPPIGTLTIADPQNWIALFAFLATSLTASQLSARAKRRTLEAEERRAEVESLYALSRALLLVDTSQPIAKQIVHQVALTCGFPGVALYVRANGEIYRAGLADPMSRPNYESLQSVPLCLRIMTKI